jgi:hypothetical protein
VVVEDSGLSRGKWNATIDEIDIAGAGRSGF